MRVNPSPEDNKKSRNVRREKRRWDDENFNSLSMGCIGCIDFKDCGGENKRQQGMSCHDDCCGEPDNCRIMCPRNALFTQMIREINGFSLDTVGSVKPNVAPISPVYVPLIYHRSNRPIPLEIDVAAIPLHKLYDKRDGRVRYNSPGELREGFGLCESARVLLIGSGRDQPLENWWGLSERRLDVLSRIRDLNVEFISAPNYSLFTDVPRYDNLRNMKRIVISWAEIMNSGLPAGLHLNARTVRDYNRFLAFLTEHSEVSDVSFEFRTVWKQRRSFHAWHLARLGRLVERPLSLVTVGGLPLIKTLAPAFSRVTFIDSHAFMTATYRQRVIVGNDGSLTKATAHTVKGEPVHELTAENIRVMREYVTAMINEARVSQPESSIERSQRSPGRAASAKAARR